LKNVIYTGVDLQVIHFYLNSYKTPACKVIRTEIVTQELLHRSSANFQVIKLYLNFCKIRLLQFKKTMYGTQDASHMWQEDYSNHLKKKHFHQGQAWTSVFRHDELDIKLLVHGDDFLVLADQEGQ